MSLILDALKKSEAERRLGQAPGLSSAFAQAPRRGRGPLLWSLLLLMVVSTAALWHNRALLGFEGQAGAESTDPDAALAVVQHDQNLDSAAATDLDAAAAPTRKSADRADAAKARPQAAPLPMPRPQNLAAAADPDDPMAGVSAEHRAMIEQGELVVPHPQILAQRGATRDPQIVTAEAALPPTIETPAAVETEDGRVIYPEANATPAKPSTPAAAPSRGLDALAALPRAATAEQIAAPSATPTGPAATGAATGSTSNVTSTAASPSTRGLPLIYDLTLAQRQGLPALKISMHVYHRDVARRFVIIDGQRLNEGDPIGQLLWARKIVPEGVIIEYRDLRFLLPRPGG